MGMGARHDKREGAGEGHRINKAGVWGELVAPPSLATAPGRPQETWDRVRPSQSGTCTREGGESRRRAGARSVEDSELARP
jgi:hypothetical protein